MPTATARLAMRMVVLALVFGLGLVVLGSGHPAVSVAQEETSDNEAPPPDAEPTPESPLLPAASPAPPVASPAPIQPPAARPLPSHDWRTTGYASLVGGKLFDPSCRPLRSIGSNVPNLMFRDGLRENLEWMRQHQMRWLRVIATGHGTLRPVDQIEVNNVAQRLAELLHEVEAFNAAHPQNESIYVLVGLTDYYEPGVPGDQYGFDHAGWCQARVLNAPWYHRGFPRYSFEQECGGGRLANAPNYEVNFKPWVERLVAVGARSPALLGWQLGNELKSRDSRRNDIDDAYDWYVDWLADMTDTIRQIDRNHLVVTGTQYLAELTDYAYRPNDGDPDPRLEAGYAERFDRILRGCNAYCWNVWSLTDYDFHHYAIDDAMYLQQMGVATLVTEYGFTLGTPDEERGRFGGDRLAALRNGLSRPWVDITGEHHPYDWNTSDLIDATGMQGVAPWASPAPEASASPAADLDSLRGLSLAREGDAFWQAWHEIAGRLEASNSSAGVSAACSAFVSE
jgi:hypothetical protein